MAKKIEKLTFWQKVHNYRLVILLILFLVVIPLLILIGVYANAFQRGRQISFDNDITSETKFVKYSSIINPDESDLFEFDLTWTDLVLPKEDDEGNLTGGYYRFSFTYKLRKSSSASDIRVTPLLHVPWSNIRSLGNQTTITAGAKSNFQVTFNHTFPIRPILFVRVDDPVLFLMVEYDVNNALGQPTTNFLYVRFNLSEMNPNKVSSAT